MPCADDSSRYSGFRSRRTRIHRGRYPNFAQSGGGQREHGEEVLSGPAIQSARRFRPVRTSRTRCEIVGRVRATRSTRRVRKSRSPSLPSRGEQEEHWHRGGTFAVTTSIAGTAILPVAARTRWHRWTGICRCSMCAPRRSRSRPACSSERIFAESHRGLRRAGAGAGVDWDLRHHGVFGLAAHERDRHPHGSGCAAAPRAADGAR